MSNIKKLMMSAAGGSGLDVDEVFSTYLWNFSSAPFTVNNGIDLSGEGGLVWVKGRTSNNHWLHDSERTVSKALFSNLTDAEYTTSSSITSFNSNGFTVGGIHSGSVDHASWTFRKAPKFFDVVTYTGNGTQGRTVSHNLGSAPGFIVVKKTSSTGNWPVYHRGMTSALYGMQLNSTNDEFDADSYWDSTDPTDSVFTLGNNSDVNQSGATYVAYLFAHNDGDGEFGPNGDADIIKCGSLTADSSGGATVDLGWEPQWLLYKKTNGAQGWLMHDTMRGWGTSGLVNNVYANFSVAESNIANSSVMLSPTATGFSSTGNWFGANSEYIYMAIRRGPMAVPESATDVFDVVSQTPVSNLSGTEINSSTGVVDFVSTKVINGSGIIDWGQWDRFRGGARLRTNSTAVENDFGTTYNMFFDYSDGFLDNFYYPQGTITSTVIYHMWKRAPSFFDGA